MKLFGITGAGTFIFSWEDEKSFPGRDNNLSRPSKMSKGLIGSYKASVPGERTVIGNKRRWRKSKG